MSKNIFSEKIHTIFSIPIDLHDNFVLLSANSGYKNQQQTNHVFTEKWKHYNTSSEKLKLYEFQKKWYLSLYGFGSEAELAVHLSKCKIILDAGCGLGYKSAWFAELAPESLVIGIDYSEAALQASSEYKYIPNLFFMQGDIANTKIKDGSVDYISCDQVIMHTENPDLTFLELVRICSRQVGQIACYFYAKKALPRELLDDYFRVACKSLSDDELWAMSGQLTELGRRLSNLNVSFECPDIPALGIKGGKCDIQRFIYWNFMKCFWNEGLGPETSIATNYDWYSPSNAKRFSEAEVRSIVKSSELQEIYFHIEEACYSGRFLRSV